MTFYTRLQSVLKMPFTPFWCFSWEFPPLSPGTQESETPHHNPVVPKSLHVHFLYCLKVVINAFEFHLLHAKLEVQLFIAVALAVSACGVTTSGLLGEVTVFHVRFNSFMLD